MNKEALRWLTQASDDLGTAQILFDSQRYGPCAFFCEQAAEKGLKAVLYLEVSDLGDTASHRCWSRFAWC